MMRTIGGKAVLSPGSPGCPGSPGSLNSYEKWSIYGFYRSFAMVFTMDFTYEDYEDGDFP